MSLEAYANPDSLPSGQSARVARLLAIQDPDAIGDLQLAKCVSDGLDTGAAFALGDVLGRKHVIGPIIPEATLRRARKAGKPLSKDLSERLYEVGRVVDAVGVVYHGDWHSMGAFLDRPHPLLDGSTPFDMARSSSAGADAVLNLIHRLEAGMVV